MGAFTQEMENHKTAIRRGRVDIHRNKRSTGLLRGLKLRLPEVVSALNNKVTSLTRKKPAVAIKEKAVAAKSSTKYSRPVRQKEKQPPLPRKRPVFVSTRGVRRWYKKSHRSNLVFESIQRYWSVTTPKRSPYCITLARRSQARLLARRTAGYFSKHSDTSRAAALKFYDLLI